MISRYSFFAGLALLFIGCSSVNLPKAELAEHNAERNIPPIDEMIVSLKKSYISNVMVLLFIEILLKISVKLSCSRCWNVVII